MIKSITTKLATDTSTHILTHVCVCALREQTRAIHMYHTHRFKRCVEKKLTTESEKEEEEGETMSTTEQ